MFRFDNQAIEGCDSVKQCIINHSGSCSTAQLYINVPIRLSHTCISLCSFL